MTDRQAADMAMAILMAVRTREGTDEAVEAAKHMIYGATSIIAHEFGPKRPVESSAPSARPWGTCHEACW